MNQEQYNMIVRGGVPDWNIYRNEHPDKHIDLGNSDFDGMLLFRINLKNANLELSSFEYTDFSHAHAEKACFIKANLKNSVAYFLYASEARFYDAIMYNAQWRFAVLNHAELSNLSAQDSIFSGSSMHHAQCYCSDFSRAELEQVNAFYTEFLDGKYEHTNFNGSNLINTSFANSYMEKARLEYCDLRDASFKKAMLRKASFRYSDMRNVDFTGADLTEVDLRRANITDARFDKAKLKDVIW